MREIVNLIENALSSLGLDVARIHNPNPTTDPYIIYSQVTKSPNLFADNREQSRTFYIDVDIYTTDPSLIDITSEEVERRLVETGFTLKPSAGTLVEDDISPTMYHEPLEFSYEKELNS